MAQVKIYPYDLLVNNDGRCYFPSGFRSGLMIEFVENNVDRFFSEWAPLKGIHLHSIDDGAKAVASINRKDLETFIALIGNENHEELDQIFRESFSYPLSFILSLGLFHAQTRSLEFSDEPMMYSALILPHHSMSQVLSMVNEGYQCLKIKVGTSIFTDIKRITAIRESVGGSVLLRLDANRKLSFFEAQQLLDGIENIGIQYIEEPTFELSRLAGLYERTGAAIALDESFGHNDSLDKLLRAKAHYLVIKASRFNNIFSVMNLCKAAQALGITPIFSHCFESDFYASLMVLLVKKLKLSHHTHGIYSNIFNAKES